MSQSPTSANIRSIQRKLSLMSAEEGVKLTNQEIDMLKEALTSIEPSASPVEIISGSDKDERLREISRYGVVNGFCYIVLLMSLPSIFECDAQLFKDAFLSFIELTGKFPTGTDVITNLSTLESVLCGLFTLEDFKNNDPAFLVSSHAHLKSLARITESQHRYDYEDNNGILHVKYNVECKCPEVLCAHGWSVRFIMQLITRKGRVLGGDVNFSDLFVRPEPTTFDDDFTTAPLNVSNQYGARSKTVLTVRPPSSKRPTLGLNKIELTPEDEDELSKIKEDYLKTVSRRQSDAEAKVREANVESAVSKDLVEMLEGQLAARTETLQLALEGLLEAKGVNAAKSKGSGNVETRRSHTFSSEDTAMDSEPDCASSIAPNDSSSVIERYQKKFMNSGPILHHKRNLSKVDESDEFSNSIEELNIVRGFLKTRIMAENESNSNSQIKMINGLAAPFESPRLNFLIHFHTALATCPVGSKDSPLDSLEHIFFAKPRTPTEMLIHQVVERTFCFDVMEVVANPFNLPFIEVGMQMTNSSIAKCFSLMHSEYKTKWFESMKCLIIPSFHREFQNYMPGNMQGGRVRRSRTEPDVSSGTVEEPKGRSTFVRQKRTASILGIKI